MYCKHCGKKLDNDSKFCQFCGIELKNITESDPWAEELIERTKREFKEEMDRKYGSTADKYRKEEEKQKQVTDAIAAGISIAAGWKLGKALSDFAGHKERREKIRRENAKDEFKKMFDKIN